MPVFVEIQKRPPCGRLRNLRFVSPLTMPLYV